MFRYPKRTEIVLLTVVAVGLLSGPASAQQGAVAIGEDRGHTIIAYPTDGEYGIRCLQGDRHRAVEALLWLQLRAEASLTEAAGPELSTMDPAAGAGDVTVRAAMRFVNRARAGADLRNWPLLFTPRELMLGSSVSHFDKTASPNLLMEPNISLDLPLDQLDLTDDALRDLGWRGGNDLQTEVEFTDPDGFGFNDDELGPERRDALEAVLDVWGAALGNNAPVVIDASFEELRCDPNEGAVLAFAGPTTVFRDFEGAEPDTWYPGPVAESIAGRDLSSDDGADIRVTFNSAIDEGCLGPGTRWFYGTEGEIPAGTAPFVSVGLHELGHGLGFVSLTDAETGELFGGFPDIFTRTIFDNRREKSWDELGSPGRRVSATRDGKVVFRGRRARRGVRRTLDGSVILKITEPRPIAGLHRVGTAEFGPMIEDGETIFGELVLADQGAPMPRLACRELQNPDEIEGNIAVVDRGECPFTEKARNAQDAGAIGVVVINNVPGGPIQMGGEDATIAIPAVMVDIVLGRKIRRRIR